MIKSDYKCRAAALFRLRNDFIPAAYSFSFIDVLAPLLLSVGENHRNCMRTMIRYRRGLTAAVSKVTRREAILETTLYAKDKNALCITTSDDNDDDATTRSSREQRKCVV